MKSRSSVNGRGTRFGMYLPMMQLGILVARHDALQRAAEVGDADPQHRRVERHVDTGHQDERPLAAADLAALLDLLFQYLKAAHGARDGVLRAAQVEVHDLKEFACALGDLVDEPGDVASSRSICDGRIAASR